MQTLMPLLDLDSYTRVNTHAGMIWTGGGLDGYDTGAIGEHAVAHRDHAEPGQFSSADPAVYEAVFRRPAGANRAALFCARLVGAKYLYALWPEQGDGPQTSGGVENSGR